MCLMCNNLWGCVRHYVVLNIDITCTISVQCHLILGLEVRQGYFVLFFHAFITISIPVFFLEMKFGEEGLLFVERENVNIVWGEF